jgi:hypothetical protein
MTCGVAAGGGHLKVLQWARAEECSWNAMTCMSAARNGHLEVLQWARAEGCPWDATTSEAAARGGHLKVLQWALANGCPSGKHLVDAAARGGHIEVLKWTHAHVACESCRDIVLLRGLRRGNFKSTAPGRDSGLGGGLVVSCNECRLGWTLLCVQLCAARAYRLVVAAVDHNVNLGGVPAVVVFPLIADAVTLLDSAANQVQGPLDCLGPRRGRAHVGDC